jgi:hypothetical protein
MKRSSWKKQRTEAGLRTPVPDLPKQAEERTRAVKEYRGESLGFGGDRARAWGHPVPKVRGA